MRYQICTDYNLKCYRLYVDDGMFMKDAGTVDGDEAFRKQDVARRLAAIAALRGQPNAAWEEIK